MVNRFCMERSVHFSRLAVQFFLCPSVVDFPPRYPQSVVPGDMVNVVKTKCPAYCFPMAGLLVENEYNFHKKSITFIIV